MKLFLSLFFALSSVFAAAETSITLPARVSVLMQNDAVFEPFGRALAKTVEAQLKTSPTAADKKLLLSLRLHLAISLSDHATTLDATELIRSALPDNADKLYSGLTTKASLTAQTATHALSGDPNFNAVFLQDFSARLKELPDTAAVTTMLATQKARAEKATIESLRAEIVTIDAQFGDRSQCSWAEADQIVRLRHRFRDILPVRQEIIAALDRTLRGRTSEAK